MLAWMVATLAPAPDVPFEALANELLALERPELVRAEPEEDSLEGRLRQRLLGFHHRIPLGALELWIPVATLASPGRIEDAPPAKALREHALGLIDLQRLWLSRTGLSGDDWDKAQEDLDTVAHWARSFRRQELPELSDKARQAILDLDQVFLTTPATDRVPSRRLLPPVIVIAPTRTHYAALIGVTGIERPGFQDLLWTDDNARTVNQWPGWRTAYIGLTLGAARDEGPALLDNRLNPKELHQTIVHFGSLMLSHNVCTTLPPWWTEGIAICDTVQVVGADETFFSGHRRSDSDAALSQLSQLFSYIYRENSPYREGPSRRWFTSELRKAYKKEGFEILNLVQGGVALHVRGPFLGPQAKVPTSVLEGPPGAKNGYAEFTRAYAACFIHWLSERETLSGATSLDRLLAEVRERSMGLMPPPRKVLDPSVRASLERSLGASTDPESDLEAEFLHWLVGTRR